MDTQKPAAGRWRNRRTAVWAVALLVAVLLWPVSHIQSARLQDELEPMREQHLEENQTGSGEVASLVTVSRDALVFGTPRAKIEVFVRAQGAEDAAADFGVEYYYERQDGEWTLTGSAACTSESCVVRGRKAFMD